MVLGLRDGAGGREGGGVGRGWEVNCSRRGKGGLNCSRGMDGSRKAMR